MTCGNPAARQDRLCAAGSQLTVIASTAHGRRKDVLLSLGSGVALFLFALWKNLDTDLAAVDVVRNVTVIGEQQAQRVLSRR